MQIPDPLWLLIGPLLSFLTLFLIVNINPPRERRVRAVSGARQSSHSHPNLSSSTLSKFDERMSGSTG
jgi:hypothetical protein